MMLRAPTAADVPAVTAMMNARGVALHGSAVGDDGDAPYRALLEERGYHVVRASYHMSGDFPGAPAEPHPPDGVTIRRHRAGEERAVHAVVTDAFSEGWDFTPQPFEEFLRGAVRLYESVGMQATSRLDTNERLLDG